MGDRANVAVVQDSGNSGLVYLYTHWGGTELPLDVKAALAKRWRWRDGAYLTRIIFDQMIGEKGHGQETGFGIATYRCDNEHAIVVVNPETQKIGFAKEGAEPECYKEWAFDEYVKASDKELETAYRQHRE